MTNPNIDRLHAIEHSEDNEHPFHLNKRGRRAVAAVALVASVSAGASVPVVAEHVSNSIDKLQNPVEFSENETTYTLEQGEGLDHAIYHINGIEGVEVYPVKEHVKNDPANTEVFADNILQVGESIVIPESVSSR